MNRDFENVQQAKESFNRILYNKKYSSIIRDDRHLEILLSLVEGGTYNRILDIGTGTGYLAFPLAEKYSTSTVYGIDIAGNVIEKNRNLVKEKKISNLFFLSFDGLKYPFAEESFDLIVTRHAFHHFPNVIDTIQQINKLLVKGGKVLISDPLRKEEDNKRIIDEFMKVKKDGHIQFYSIKELEKLFSDNGFVVEKQIITDMKFPFPSKDEYITIYNKMAAEDRLLYNLTNENNIIYVQHINVGNTIFVKK